MLTVGIDPHKHNHTAVMLDERGHHVAGPKVVADQPEAVDRLCRWAARHARDREVRWAIEDGRGLACRLAGGLVAAGKQVCWVPVRLMVAARRGSPAGRGKSDPIDATAVAAAAGNPDNARLLCPADVDPRLVDVRDLLDAHDRAVDQRTRTINTLRWRLHRLGIDTPRCLTSLIACTQTTTALAAAPAGIATELASAELDDLAATTTRITRLRRRLTGLVVPLCPHLLAIPGVGVLSAARLITDASHTRSGAALARLAGTAPIPVWTSNHTRHRLDPGGNRRLNHTIHQIAITQIRCHPPATDLYHRRQHDKGRKGALRILKRHLTDVLHHALTTDLATPA